MATLPVRFPVLAPRDRRALGLGAAVLGPALLWAFVVAPVTRALDAQAARLAAERQLFSREAGLLEDAARARAARDTSASRLLAVAPRLFGGGAAAAAAGLAQYLQEGARRSRVLVTHIETLPVQRVDSGIAAVAVRVHGESDLEGVLTLLYALEGGSKLVRIDDLHIPAQDEGQRFGSTGTALTFEFTATGFVFEVEE